MSMNPILAQLYATEETVKTASAQNTYAQNEEDALNAAILDDLVKVAAAENFDLNQLSDEELVQLVEEHKGELMKQASYEEAGYEGGTGASISEDAMAEADILGRTMAHAFFAEKAEIEAAGAHHEKLAGLSDEELFEELAFARAENILAALEGDFDNFVKEASIEIDAGMEDLDDAISMRAAEILDANDYDVDAIAAALDDSF